MSETEKQPEMNEMQQRAQRAIKIASKVAKIIVEEVVKLEQAEKENKPFMLEDMVHSYVVAMANFSVYQSMKKDNKALKWEQFEAKAIDGVKCAFDHISQTEIARKH